ncbi:MAG TPA: hypothetical protein ENK05_12675 [Gammaproteobacteria bacterium]|nr:hypothetical protein [Gammaproteobacteria bacterium]
MSEEKQLAAPEPSSPPPGEVSPTPPPAGARGTVALVLALLALGISIGLAVAAYFSWHQIQQLHGSRAALDSRLESRLQPLRDALRDLNQSLQALDHSMQTRSSKVDHSLEQLQQRWNTLQQRVEVLGTLMGRSEHDWNLAEVEYLLRIASQRLQLQRDTVTAIAALKSADQRLRELADPQYLGVREQIARDIEAVESVPAVDVEGISARLKAALAQIDRLPVAGAHYRPPASGGSAERSPQKTARSLEELPAVVWDAVRELVTVRELERPVAPMLPPEREYFLRQNLRLQLEAARLALLRGDPLQYRDSLSTARSWLEGWFDTEDAGVRELSKQLQQLEAIDIRPALPDISASLRLLRRQMKLTARREALPQAAGGEETPAEPAQ